jgi:hypothetical protein
MRTDEPRAHRQLDILARTRHRAEQIVRAAPGNKLDHRVHASSSNPAGAFIDRLAAPKR